jgi:hypothetical protein
MTLPDGGTNLGYSPRKPVKLIEMSGFSSAAIGEDLAALGMEIFSKSGALVTPMQSFHGLFESDCNEQADGDSGDVDEKVPPRMNRFIGSVYFELSHNARKASDISGPKKSQNTQITASNWAPESDKFSISPMQNSILLNPRARAPSLLEKAIREVHPQNKPGWACLFRCRQCRCTAATTNIKHSRALGRWHSLYRAAAEPLPKGVRGIIIDIGCRVL